MNFDQTLSKTVCGETVRYGIVRGNGSIVFLKAGAGGSIRGYGDKYLQMAYRAREKFGSTVICASNPDVPHAFIDEQIIRQVAAGSGSAAFALSFVGTSDGAYQILTLAGRFPETVRLLGINPSFVTVPGLQEKLLALPHVEKIFVYGTKDDAYDRVVPALNAMQCERFRIVIVEGADHRFTGMTEKLISLIDLLETR
ncbi:MAG: hypothetical protein J1E00_08965 [Oscillospiraceae bacterium]|nr:hypothetical protein [Oscillospiraceae bacterium]